MIPDVESPCILIDTGRLEANIARMQRKALARKVALRPHAKTHKVTEIAGLQLAAGAVGLTTSKSEEAVTFIEAGVPSVTVAYPLADPRKVDRVLGAARHHGTDTRFIVDSEAGLDLLAACAADRSTDGIPVLIKIDVGLGRCGLKEADPRIIDLARRADATRGLTFAGLLSHAGHAYAAGNADAVRAIATEEAAILNRLRSCLDDAGIATPCLSVGSTPTVLAAEDFGGVDEIRPGNYVFMDLTQLRLGVASLDEVALTVLTTVVSSHEGQAIIDAGSKVLSTDLGPHGTGSGGYGRAWLADAPLGDGPGFAVTRLSEEHGFVATDGARLPVGTRLRIVPNHSCPVANLADRVIAFSDGVSEPWPVAARGKVR
ncbi:MAG: alanine racemase [Rhodospirillaceae bacterium]|nr:alanine racemase [Rhodospirillaceae bacterium]